MAPERNDDFRRLAKKYRIFFDGPIPRNQWPGSHAELFGNIQLLGGKTYDGYKTDRAKRSLGEPWGAHTAQRAERIVGIAKRCRSENRNEAGWRIALEPEVFSRFTIEVAWYASLREFALPFWLM